MTQPGALDCEEQVQQDEPSVLQGSLAEVSQVGLCCVLTALHTATTPSRLLLLLERAGLLQSMHCTAPRAADMHQVTAHNPGCSFLPEQHWAGRPKVPESKLQSAIIVQGQEFNASHLISHREGCCCQSDTDKQLRCQFSSRHA